MSDASTTHGENAAVGRCYVCGERSPCKVLRHSVKSGVTNARGPFVTRYVRKCADCAPYAFTTYREAIRG